MTPVLVSWDGQRTKAKRSPANCLSHGCRQRALQQAPQLSRNECSMGLWMQEKNTTLGIPSLSCFCYHSIAEASSRISSTTTSKNIFRRTFLPFYNNVIKNGRSIDLLTLFSRLVWQLLSLLLTFITKDSILTVTVLPQHLHIARNTEQYTPLKTNWHSSPSWL